MKTTQIYGHTAGGPRKRPEANRTAREGLFQNTDIIDAILNVAWIRSEMPGMFVRNRSAWKAIKTQPAALPRYLLLSRQEKGPGMISLEKVDQWIAELGIAKKRS